MRTLTVALSDQAYDIHIGSGVLDRTQLIVSHLPAERVAVVSNSVVAPLYLQRLVAPLRADGVRVTEIVLPDGERHKTWETLNSIFDALLADRCDRTTTVVALGGGVIGDLAGFAAATYQRGVPFIQVPTTLLAQVDSSVGGKTGINHPRGKNMIGAFWQPKVVVADTDVLTTLPDRELSAGMAEVIKYGLIRDLPFLQWLEANVERLMERDADALAYAIERSCANKAEVVAGDERETAKDNGRALLNLGHTFGHAIETGLGYGELLHGEAVAAGTVMAAELSRRLGWIDAADVARVRELLIRAKLPVVGARLGIDRYLDLMGHDKKVFAGRLRLVLLRQLGEATTLADVPVSEICAAIDTCCS
ncbi:MAG: 3-dehydroquinate synthase [Gammaproteobacteria bacterium]|nr:3-dehydroquinate synthase [Gammaproteobacteria bacterium]MBU1414400.1 3-dehydroquinate synthase [Gammaproteobacteria bacterium]